MTEAAQHLFAKAGKDPLLLLLPDSGRDVLEEDLGDLDGTPLLLAVPPDVSHVSLLLPIWPQLYSRTVLILNPCLGIYIFTAVTTCNSSIADLTGEVKSMNVEISLLISLLRQDMQN